MKCISKDYPLDLELFTFTDDPFARQEIVIKKSVFDNLLKIVY